MERRKKRIGKRSAYHSYHGIKGIPFLPPHAPISLGEGIYFDQGCPGHVVLGPPEGSRSDETLGKEKNS